MKVFGKRKKPAAGCPSSLESTTSPSDCASKTSATAASVVNGCNENVQSYFAPNFRPPSSLSEHDSGADGHRKKNSNQLEQLLSMDYGDLNAKQRRMVKRHKDRLAAATANENVEEAEIKEERREEKGSKEGSEDAEGESSAPLAKPSVGVTSIGGNYKEAAGCASSSPAVSSSSDNCSSSSSASYDGQKRGTKNNLDDDDGATAKSSGVFRQTEEEVVVPSPLQSPIEGEALLKKLEGLNSKERRTLLRKIRKEGGDNIDEILAKAEGEAKRIAERNREAEKLEHFKNIEAKKRKREDSGNSKVAVSATEVANCGEVLTEGAPAAAATAGKPHKKSRRRKGKVDESKLTPEERERREQQRLMQKKAAERRASGEIDTSRHPLNSERRRANRRKPGRAGLIAAANKERRRLRGEFNAVGFQMRRGNRQGAVAGGAGGDKQGGVGGSMR